MSYRRLIHQMLAASPIGCSRADLAITGASKNCVRESLLALRNAGIAAATHNGGSLCRWALVEHIDTARAYAESQRAEYTRNKIRRNCERKKQKRAQATNAVLAWAESDPVQRIVPVEQTTIQKRGPASVWELAA